jgi:hypothetical protein
LFIDGKLLNQWRHELLVDWVKREIDLRALYEAVIQISTLPKDTVQSMLETLPSAGDLVAEQGVSASTRTAIAAVVTTIHTYRSSDIALKATGYTIAGGVLIFAAALWTWQPLLGAFAVGLIILLKNLGKKRRLKGARERINTAQQEPDFDTEKFLEIVNKINWTPNLASEKKTILTVLSISL